MIGYENTFGYLYVVYAKTNTMDNAYRKYKEMELHTAINSSSEEHLSADINIRPPAVLQLSSLSTILFYLTN
jgi:hypothetical protein